MVNGDTGRLQRTQNKADMAMEVVDEKVELEAKTDQISSGKMKLCAVTKSWWSGGDRKQTGLGCKYEWQELAWLAS